MPKFLIEVVVDPSRARAGTRAVRGELGRTETAAERLGRTLRRAFALVGTSILVRQLGSLADEFTNVQNRLRTVTDGEAELVAVTNELFAISNRTRSSYSATAEVFARVGLAAKNLGRDQQELLQFTESLNQAVLLSGASSEEARAGLIQLSQGLASGALRGEELNSVLEQLPVVADVIAESLGITRGELRALGAEGKISAEIVLDAFKQARAELEDRFGEAVPTLSQSFTVLRNRILQTVGAGDQLTGTSRALSDAILGLSERVTTLGAAFEVTFGIARELIPIVRNDLVTLGASFDEAFDNINTLPDIIALVGDRTLGLLQGTGNAAIALFRGIGPLIEGDFIRVVNSVGNAVETSLDFIQAFFVTTLTVSQNTGRAILNFFRELDTANRLVLSGSVEEGLKIANEAQQTLSGQIGGVGRTFATTFKSSFTELSAEDLIPDLSSEFTITGEQFAESVREGFFGGLDVTLLRDTLGDIRERAAQADAALASTGASAGETAAGGVDAYTASVDRASEATRRLVDGPLKEQNAVFDLLGTALDNGERAFANFLSSGELGFSQFVNSLQAEASRLLSQQLFSSLFGGLNPLSAAGGAAAGAGASTAASFGFGLFGGFRQGGGPVSPGRSFIVGEDGPELFQPPTAGNVVPAGETAAMMAQRQEAPNVNVSPAQVSVINVSDPSEIPVGIQSAQGQQAVLNVIRRNRRAVRGTLG